MTLYQYTLWPFFLMFESFLCIVCESFLVKLTFVEVHDKKESKSFIFIGVLYELNLFHFKVRVISWSSSWEVYKYRQKAANFNSHLKTFFVEFRFEFYIKNKAHRNQNNIPSLYILEIDSSVFKSVQISCIFCRFVQEIKKITIIVLPLLVCVISLSHAAECCNFS